MSGDKQSLLSKQRQLVAERSLKEKRNINAMERRLSFSWPFIPPKPLNHLQRI
jgi:hypothetical protein